MTANAVLKNRYLNGWFLFVLISLPISALVVIELLATDVSSGAGVSHMIGYSVRFAIPLIFVVTATSALQTLFPGPATSWFLRSRKYVGLAFAVAMAWQGLFILTMSLGHRGYYYSDIYLLRDEIEGSIGYLFLTAMVVTSFRFGRRRLTQQQWKLLHTAGVYFLWAYPFSTYWWTVVGYYGEVSAIDYLLYGMGFVAFAVRIAAWGKRRMQSIDADPAIDNASLATRLLGGVLIGIGLYAGATAAFWQHAVSGWLRPTVWSANLELWLPYWPFDPFWPLLVIGIGTLLATKSTEKQRLAVAV